MARHRSHHHRYQGSMGQFPYRSNRCKRLYRSRWHLEYRHRPNQDRERHRFHHRSNRLAYRLHSLGQSHSSLRQYQSNHRCHRPYLLRAVVCCSKVGTIRLDNRHRLYLPMRMGRVGTYLVQQYNCLLLEIQDRHRFHHHRYQG